MAPWLPPAKGGRRSRVFPREVVTLGAWLRDREPGIKEWRGRDRVGQSGTGR